MSFEVLIIATSCLCLLVHTEVLKRLELCGACIHSIVMNQGAQKLLREHLSAPALSSTGSKKQDEQETLTQGQRASATTYHDGRQDGTEPGQPPPIKSTFASPRYPQNDRRESSQPHHLPLSHSLSLSLSLSSTRSTDSLNPTATFTPPSLPPFAIASHHHDTPYHTLKSTPINLPHHTAAAFHPLRPQNPKPRPVQPNPCFPATSPCDRIYRSERQMVAREQILNSSGSKCTGGRDVTPIPITCIDPIYRSMFLLTFSPPTYMEFFGQVYITDYMIYDVFEVSPNTWVGYIYTTTTK